MRELLTAVILLTGLLPVQAADVFDRHTSQWLKQAAKDVKPLPSVNMEQASEWKPLSPTLTAPCIVVKTNDGNWAKAMLGWGFRQGKDKPVPVLLLERYVTYRGDRADSTVANGREVMLFAGFSFNLDIGQVVPDGQGGDIRLTETGELLPVDEAEIYPLNGSQLPAAEKANPADHDGVLPRDFTGTWKINIDGRWKGEFVLTCDNTGKASGKYTSAESQASYDITGRVSGVSHNLKLDIHLDNATQSVDVYLWTTDKNTMAGTSTLAGRTFGFHAQREQEEKAAGENPN